MIVHKRTYSHSYFLFFFACLLNITSLSAQKNVNVDLLTGTANVTIPIYNVSVGDISVPIFYNYRASGIKVEDYDQQFGLGWKLSIDAGITRILRGFPDDKIYQANTGYPAVKGWLQSGATDIPTKVANFSIAGGATMGTCSNEVTDYSYMNTNFPYYYDTEPDKFVVSAPGLNVEFVFDKTGVIRPIPFQDLRISKTTDANGAITSFTIVNDKGVTYVFDKLNAYQIKVDDTPPTTFWAFSRDYQFYKRYIPSTDYYISYTGKWSLTSITDSKLDKIYYNYDATNHGPAPVSNQKIEILKYNPSTSQYDKTYLYTKTLVTTVQRLNNIASSQPWDILSLTGDISFTWEGTYSESKLTAITLVRSGKTITPVYSGKFSGNNNANAWGRYFLMKLNLTGIGVTPSSWSFLYQNVDDVNHTSYCTFGGNDSITLGQDYWGYYNGSYTNTNLNPPVWVYPDNSNVHMFKITQIPNYVTNNPGKNEVALTGSNRSINSNAISGTLTKITYPTGGTTQLSYDNQEYLDPDPGLNTVATPGGGARIRQITNNDGISSTNEIIYYDYNDPSTSVTTGRAIAVPSFTFATFNSASYPNISDKVKNSTFRTFYDFSDEVPAIIYGKVTVRKTNGGKSLYEFKTTGTWGSANDNEWSETMVYVTRNYTSNPSPCINITPDFLKNDKNNYPYPANPDYDFERGLLTKVTNYNEQSNKISEETYTYTRSHTTSSPTNPETLIQALKFDDISGGTIRRYAKYNVVSSVTNLLSQKVTTLYTTKTPYDASAYTTETENCTYKTTGEHRLPIQVAKTNSDGTVFKTYLQYVKDYINPSQTGDVYSQALYWMQNGNDNKTVESYQTVTPPSTSEKIIAASVTTFKRYYNTESGQYMNLPYESRKFASQTGISPTGFPSVISGSNFQFYSGYIKAMTVDDYDFGGFPSCVTGTSRMSNSTINDPFNRVKVAEIGNAKNTEVIYGSFDYNNMSTDLLGYSGTNLVAGGRKSKACLNLTNSFSISHSVSNAATNSNIIFSCWIKDAASSGNLTVNLSTTGLNVNYTVPFTSNSTWTYYEIKIPRPTQSSYTVTISTSASIKIDDVLFYPGNASVKTYSYDVLTSGALSTIVCTAETGLGGSTISYEYDTSGRPYITRDGFNNIIEVKTYKPLNNW